MNLGVPKGYEGHRFSGKPFEHHKPGQKEEDPRLAEAKYQKALDDERRAKTFKAREDGWWGWNLIGWNGPQRDSLFYETKREIKPSAKYPTGRPEQKKTGWLGGILGAAGNFLRGATVGFAKDLIKGCFFDKDGNFSLGKTLLSVGVLVGAAALMCVPGGQFAALALAAGGLAMAAPKFITNANNCINNIINQDWDALQENAYKLGSSTTEVGLCFYGATSAVRGLQATRAMQAGQQVTQISRWQAFKAIPRELFSRHNFQNYLSGLRNTYWNSSSTTVLASGMANTGTAASTTARSGFSWWRPWTWRRGSSPVAAADDVAAAGTRPTTPVTTGAPVEGATRTVMGQNQVYRGGNWVSATDDVAAAADDAAAIVKPTTTPTSPTVAGAPVEGATRTVMGQNQVFRGGRWVSAADDVAAAADDAAAATSTTNPTTPVVTGAPVEGATRTVMGQNQVFRGGQWVSAADDVAGVAEGSTRIVFGQEQVFRGGQWVAAADDAATVAQAPAGGGGWLSRWWNSPTTPPPAATQPSLPGLVFSNGRQYLAPGWIPNAGNIRNASIPVTMIYKQDTDITIDPNHPSNLPRPAAGTTNDAELQYTNGVPTGETEVPEYVASTYGGHYAGYYGTSNPGYTTQDLTAGVSRYQLPEDRIA